MNSLVRNPGRLSIVVYFPAFARSVGTTYTPMMTPASNHSHLLFMVAPSPFYRRPAVTAKRKPRRSRMNRMTTAKSTSAMTL